MPSEPIVQIVNMALSLIVAIPIIIFMVVAIVLVVHFGGTQEQYRRKIRGIGAALGMTYWDGDTKGRYSDSKILGMPDVTVYHGLSSSDGIDIGLAHHGQTDQTETKLMHDYTYVQLPEDSGMYMLVDSRHNDWFGLSIMKFLGAHGGLQKFTLEGDFPTSYRVFGKTGSQIETLQLLNPKAMQQLVETFTKYDIEISGDSVFMYGADGINAVSSADVVKNRLEDAKRIRQFMTDHLPLLRKS